MRLLVIVWICDGLRRLDLARQSKLAASRPGWEFSAPHTCRSVQFYRAKGPNHPHTNCAKAALNMMTRTSAADLAAVGGACHPPMRFSGRHRPVGLAGAHIYECRGHGLDQR